jgi:hypothetical protein
MFSSKDEKLSRGRDGVGENERNERKVINSTIDQEKTLIFTPQRIYSMT